MHHFFIGFGILIAAFAIQFQPSVAHTPPAEPVVERAIFGHDDLPNGAPVEAAAKPNKRACYLGPSNPEPVCIFDSVPQCRAECRAKRLGGGAAGRRGKVKCFPNPALGLRPKPKSA
jgi:hypothetical protein